MKIYNAGDIVTVFSFIKPYEHILAEVVRDVGGTLVLKDARDRIGRDMVYGVPKALCKPVD